MPVFTQLPFPVIEKPMVISTVMRRVDIVLALETVHKDFNCWESNGFCILYDKSNCLKNGLK